MLNIFLHSRTHVRTSYRSSASFSSSPITLEDLPLKKNLPNVKWHLQEHPFTVSFCSIELLPCHKMNSVICQAPAKVRTLVCQCTVIIKYCHYIYQDKIYPVPYLVWKVRIPQIASVIQRARLFADRKCPKPTITLIRKSQFTSKDFTGRWEFKVGSCPPLAFVYFWTSSYFSLSNIQGIAWGCLSEPFPITFRYEKRTVEGLYFRNGPEVF